MIVTQGLENIFKFLGIHINNCYLDNFISNQETNASQGVKTSQKMSVTLQENSLYGL